MPSGTAKHLFRARFDSISSSKSADLVIEESVGVSIVAYNKAGLKSKLLMKIFIFSCLIMRTFLI